MTAQRRNSRLLVFGVIVALIFIIGVTATVVANVRNSDPGAHTVGEAFSGIARQNPQNEVAHSETNNSARLLELAEALGLPAESLPSYVTPGEATAANRLALRKTLEKSVGLGEISPHEANAVLKAFDLGLVTTPFSGYNADPAGAPTEGLN